MVESYRENGKSKHKRLLYFGSVDKETADRLKIAFSKDFDSFTNINKIDFSKSTSYGDLFLINSIWDKLGMSEAFVNSLRSSDRHITTQTAVKYIKALVFQRISMPGSKLALTEEYSHTSLPHFVQIENELDLQTLYRSLEVLTENFSKVEEHLYRWAYEHYQQDKQELFYDITSSYFEGRKCVIAEYGYSRDHRRDREQIVIGLVTTSDGFPIKCNIYSGNKSDKTTVKEVVTDLKKRYPIDEVIFVGDRGMLSSKNIESIMELEQKYVMAIPRAWTKKYLKDISIEESTMNKINDDLYATFLPEIDGQHFLLCLNTHKRDDDHNYRQYCIDTIKSELDDLNRSLGVNRNIKTRDEAMKRAGAISKKNTAGKYFTIKTTDSDQNTLGFSLEYELKSDKIEEDEKLDGTFVIQTNVETYEDEKLIKIYKNLNKVENAFRIIKHDLNIRPMYHWKEERVKGHVYVCVLAYFLIQAIEYNSKRVSNPLTAQKVLQQLQRINLLEINLPDGERRYSLTTIDQEVKDILKIYGIKKMKIPDVV